MRRFVRPQYIPHPLPFKPDNTTVRVTNVNPLTVTILSRTTRIVGAGCILVWSIVAGITLLTNPTLAGQSIPDMIASLEPTAQLYLFPGLILVMLGAII